MPDEPDGVPLDDPPSDTTRGKRLHQDACTRRRDDDRVVLTTVAEMMARRPTRTTQLGPNRVRIGGRGMAARFVAGPPRDGWRDGLGPYLAHPTTDNTLFFNDRAVAVRDRFPKAAVHCLLLPRDARFTHTHPLDALSRADDEGRAFLAMVRDEAGRLQRAVAADLARQFGDRSEADRARHAALQTGDGGPLPLGRDWLAEVMVGVHAKPSMRHLHVHVLSRDMHSARLTQRKHYNSFTTPFFVRLDEFPLAPDDARLRSAETDDDDDYLKQDMLCWRCGHNFGNRFAELKRHLAVEFDAWVKE